MAGRPGGAAREVRLLGIAARLLIIYVLAWIASGWSDVGIAQVARALETLVVRLGLGAVPAVFVAYLVAFTAVRLLLAPLWIAPVRFRPGRGGPSESIGTRALDLELRLLGSRLALVAFVDGLVLLLALRALPSVIDPAGVALADWLAPLGRREDLVRLAAVHAGALMIGWVALKSVTVMRAPRAPVPFGFVHYQRDRLPVWWLQVRIVAFVHLPLAAHAVTALSHPFELLVVGASLLSILPMAALAVLITLAIARRHDRWLAGIEPEARRDPHGHAASLRLRTLSSLYPERVTFPFSGDGPRAGPRPGGRDDDRPEEPDAPDAPGVDGELEDPDGVAGFDESAEPGGTAESPAPDQRPRAAVPELSARLLERALAELEAGRIGRARSLLHDVVRVGDAPERERARALLAGLPGRFAWGRAIVTAAGIAVLVGVGYLGWQWARLPSTDETRQLARSAHVHVRKRGTGEGVDVALLGTRYDYSLNTRLENVSAHFVNAVLASEDHRFLEHGVAYKVGKFVQAGLRCAMRKLNVLAGPRGCRGNSTIGQQLARNLFLSETRTVGRKLRELLWAIKMEIGLGKEEILELYLNRIYLGRGNFGVEMASRSYFLKSARELDRLEAAYLAAAIKRPAWNWHQDRAGADTRARLILALMRKHGYAPPSLRFPAQFSPRYGKRPLSKPYLGHLWQWVRPRARRILAAYPDGDYKIVTSLDAEIEVYAERHLEGEIARLRRAGIPAGQGAVVVMRPDGAVLAMVGGVGDTVLARGRNRAKRTAGLHPRPPASAFKPVVYLAALEAGLRPDSIIDASPVSIPVPGSTRPYRPRNHDGSVHGPVTLREGLVDSINTAAVRLLHEQVGFERLLDTATRLGIDTAGFDRLWGIALGQAGVPLIELTGAYASFANGGRASRPYAVTAVTNESGRTVWRRPSGTAPRAFAPAAIRDLNRMLVAVVEEGTGRRARARLEAGGRIAGKTGTGDDFVDAWFVGYTADIVIGVWIGNDRPRSMPDVYGGTAPAIVFNRILRDLVRFTRAASVDRPLP